MNSYPVLAYQDRFQIRNKCEVCQLTFEDTDPTIALECDPSHVFHRHCAFDYVKDKAKCPICKYHFAPRIIDYANKEKPKKIEAWDDIHENNRFENAITERD
mmetsp:Transcript_29870/g.29029  ORF Transcript_29870/g.29029 Transcript_29870/m.29029 type:complete len:102 (-) Transcript_29870:63-368(-)